MPHGKEARRRRNQRRNDPVTSPRLNVVVVAKFLTPYWTVTAQVHGEPPARSVTKCGRGLMGLVACALRNLERVYDGTEKR